MVARNALSPTEKYLGFKHAHDTFKTYRDRREFLSAYVVAFSIFEDRVTASYLLGCDLTGKARPANWVSLSTMIGALQAAGYVSRDCADLWRRAAHDRNHHLHAAMWTTDAVTDANCAAALAAAREANRLSMRLKRSMGAGTR